MRLKMSSIKSRKWILSGIVIFAMLLEITSSQSSCTLPNNQEGTCVTLEQCPLIKEILESSPKPLPSEVANYIKSIHCGKINNLNAICCKTLKHKESIVENSNHVNISNHPNLGLLTSSECDLTNYGTVDAPTVMPWMARLQYETSSGLEVKCEGSIINNRYILTAAHCISNLIDQKLHSVVLGEYDAEREIDCVEEIGFIECYPPKQDFSIEKTIPHENYNQSSLSNDIGLIRLSKPIIFDQDHIQPICLPTSDEALNFEIKNLLLNGWIRDFRGVPLSTPVQLQYSVENLDICREKHMSIKLTDEQFCAYETSSGNSCADVGGMSLVDLVNSNGYKYFQFGLASSGSNNCKNLPGIYINIKKYMDWILNNIEP